MKYDIDTTSKYKKQRKKLDAKSQKLLDDVINKLANGEVLDEKYRDHKLSGEYHECRECHIRPNLLLIYQKQNDVLVLLCVAVGSHGDLFG